MEKTKFRIIIVGGSISGLTLALCLEKAGTDYILLESRHNILCTGGTALAIFPSGARILDQLGLFDTVKKHGTFVRRAVVCLPDGYSFCGEYLQVFKERVGYSLTYIDRENLLRILYNAVLRQSNILTNKEVVKVEHQDSGISVLTSDGTTYDGDLVVGADGIHSKVRSEMCRLGEQTQSGLSRQSDKFGLYADYSVIYGTSRGIHRSSGEIYCASQNGTVIGTVSVKDGRCTWMVLQKLDKRYYGPDIPHFRREHKETMAKEIYHMNVFENMPFKKLRDSRQTCVMAAAEETAFKTWSFGRIVCLGDSIHKFIPLTGQGANTAIESAASLSNLLHASLTAADFTKLPTAHVASLLHIFEKPRLERTTVIALLAATACRLSLLAGVVNVLVVRCTMPWMEKVVPVMVAAVNPSILELNYVPPAQPSDNPLRPGSGLLWDLWKLSPLRILYLLAILGSGPLILLSNMIPVQVSGNISRQGP